VIEKHSSGNPTARPSGFMDSNKLELTSYLDKTLKAKSEQCLIDNTYFWDMINSCVDKGSVKDITHFYLQTLEQTMKHLEKKFIPE